MKTYEIKVIATLSDYFEFEADSLEEALEQAGEAYENGELELTTPEGYSLESDDEDDDEDDEEYDEDIDANGFDDGTHEEMEDDIDDSTFDDDIVDGFCDSED